MPTLYVFSDHDIKRKIATIAELRAALPVVPRSPSAYCLDWSDKSIQLWYGDPDQSHCTVKYISHYGVEKQQHDTVKAATDAFLTLVETALN